MKKSDSLVVYNASYTMNKQIELEWEARKWRERERKKKSEFGLREPVTFTCTCEPLIALGYQSKAL